MGTIGLETFRRKNVAIFEGFVFREVACGAEGGGDVKFGVTYVIIPAYGRGRKEPRNLSADKDSGEGNVKTEWLLTNSPGRLESSACSGMPMY